LFATKYCSVFLDEHFNPTTLQQMQETTVN